MPVWPERMVIQGSGVLNRETDQEHPTQSRNAHLSVADSQVQSRVPPAKSAYEQESVEIIGVTVKLSRTN